MIHLRRQCGISSSSRGGGGMRPLNQHSVAGPSWLPWPRTPLSTSSSTSTGTGSNSTEARCVVFQHTSSSSQTH